MHKTSATRSSIGLFVLLISLAACARKSGWDRPVVASTAEEWVATHEHLVSELNREELQTFDTAIQELKLDAMNKGVAGTALREQHVREIINGKSAAAVALLGWQARRERLQRELQDMSGRLAHDAQLADRPTPRWPSRTVSNLIQNEQEIIAQLKKQLEETERRISEWGASSTR